MTPRFFRLLLLPGLACALSAAEPKPVVDFAQIGAEMLAVPSPGDQVTVKADMRGGLDIAIAPGPLNYPGITFSFAEDTLGIDDCGYIELRLTNTSDQTMSVNLRVDSIPSGDTPRGRSTAVAYLKAGESGQARAYFANATRGYGPVVPRLIKQVLIFTAKSTDKTRSLHIEALEAAGTPGELPER